MEWQNRHLKKIWKIFNQIKIILNAIEAINTK